MHGWINLAPFTWNQSKQFLGFCLLANGEPVEVTAKQDGNSIITEVISRTNLSASQKVFVNDAVIRALDLATDTTELYNLSKSINSKYATLVKRGAGRMLRSPTLWEDAAKTLFTTNCSWGLTKIMCRSACSAYFSKATTQGAYPFPSVDKISRTTESVLKDKMRVGYRAGYLKKLAAKLKQEQASLAVENSSEEVLRQFFCSIQGFGPYATNHLLVLCGFYSQVPIDTVVKSYIRKHHHSEDYLDYIDSCYGKWGEYKWWGMKLEMISNNANWLGD